MGKFSDPEPRPVNRSGLIYAIWSASRLADAATESEGHKDAVIKKANGALRSMYGSAYFQEDKDPETMRREAIVTLENALAYLKK